MSAATHTHVVYRSRDLFVGTYRCRPVDSRVSAEEQSLGHEIVFVRRGMFEKHVGGRRVIGDANHTLFFNANEPYRIGHPVLCGDDCTIVSPSRRSLRRQRAEMERAVQRLRPLSRRAVCGAVCDSARGSADRRGGQRSGAIRLSRRGHSVALGHGAVHAKAELGRRRGEL